MQVAPSDPPADTLSTPAGRPRSGIQVPERPDLALGVVLVGELAGSAFTKSQWLIERDGHYIQVPELVYRTVEYANGERTPEEIAGLVTGATDWTVTAEHIQQIVSTKLIPLGIIRPVTSSGSVPPVPRPMAASPLLLRMRKQVLGPRAIEAIAGVLQFLYAPVVLIPLLTAATLAQAWLYFHHGLAASLRDFAYSPGAIGPVLGLLIASMLFHELGHASALRYGGGRARSIGVGLYVIFPAFYTDTTDGYRLGRWARVRTDLGGFYFMLLFALAIIQLYFVVGQEWVLAAVLVIDIEMARQLIPFIRFDGYWALTDLLGIPDILTFMKSTLLRSMQRRSMTVGWPELKPWARPVFVAYMLLTTPILTLLVLMLFVRGPLLFSALWSALGVAQERLGQAWVNGQGGHAMAAGVQLILLVAQAAGLSYVVYSVLRGLFRGLWRWSQPSTRRRLASLAVSAVAIGLLASYWNSSLGLASGGAPQGVQTFLVSQRNHVQGPVSYPQSPPVGGNHSPILQNCGFYRTPVENEHAVHSLEHGAVWITYRPDLPAGDVAALRVLAQRMSYVLVSPFPDLPTPVVASAWGRQLRLNSAGDPRLDQFLRAFRRGSQAPEHRGGPCTGGLGSPER
jgi:putative peptide zinc metalloprotease protein